MFFERSCIYLIKNTSIQYKIFLTKSGEDATQSPDQQGQSNTSRIHQYAFWGDEDAAAHHSANDKGNGWQQAYPPPEMNCIVLHIFFSFTGHIISGGRSFRDPHLLVADLDLHKEGAHIIHTNTKSDALNHSKQTTRVALYLSCRKYQSDIPFRSS